MRPRKERTVQPDLQLPILREPELPIIREPEPPPQKEKSTKEQDPNVDFYISLFV
jgi:hypothetical protein